MFSSTKSALNNFLHDLNDNERLLEISENDVNLIRDFIYTSNPNFLDNYKENLIKRGDLVGFNEKGDVVAIISRTQKMRDGKKIFTSKLLYLMGSIILYGMTGRPHQNFISEKDLNYHIAKNLGKYFVNDVIFKLSNDKNDYEYVIAKNSLQAKKKSSGSYKTTTESNIKEYKEEITKLEKQRDEIQKKIEEFKSLEDKLNPDKI
jgi:hypothetical protein